STLGNRSRFPQADRPRASPGPHHDFISLQFIGFQVDSSPDAWKQAVESYLRDKNFACSATISREALGRPYRAMRLDDWRRLAGIILSLGWKSHKVPGGRVWVKP